MVKGVDNNSEFTDLLMAACRSENVFAQGSSPEVVSTPKHFSHFTKT